MKYKNPFRRKQNLLFIVLSIASLILFLLDIALGSVAIPFADIIQILTGGEATKNTWQTIVLNFRLPSALTAVCAGVGLSLSGLLMQTLFRNPIAGPFVLGISSGAGLGVALLILTAGGLGLTATFNPFHQWTLAIFAMSGAALVLVLVLLVSRRVKDVATLLIVGLMFGSVVSAIVTVLQYYSGQEALKRFVLWSFGNLGGVTWTELKALIPLILVGTVWTFLLIKPLNALLIGEDYAYSMGISTRGVRRGVIVATAIMAGSITAFCGPVAFVGIAVPHLARMGFKTQQHRLLIPATILTGIAVMLACDILAKLPFFEQTLPINAVTSLLGAPIVIGIVLRRGKVY